MNLFHVIRQRLDERFVQSEQVARLLSLAFTSHKHVLLWGPGGHGKSEMVQLALSCVTDRRSVFVQSFGEGMDEATLWGGLNFAALESRKVLEYFPDQSFLAYDYAVFEELFDAPPVVLLSLKDTLTAEELRKGAQTFPMMTKVIVGITNKDPSEISDLGPAAAALIERFPLQLKVQWPSYTAQDYLNLFRKVALRIPGANLDGTEGMLAEVLAKAGEGGQPISPRTAVHAVGVVKAAALLRGAPQVERQDLLDLCFLPGMEQLASGLRAELDAAHDRVTAESHLQQAESMFQALMLELEEAKRAASPIRLLQVAKKWSLFVDEVANLKVTDGLSERRKRIRESAAEQSAAAQWLALQYTRIGDS
jgi:MoxR domain in the MoxR-vWA-beta-propeller ternary systems